MGARRSVLVVEDDPSLRNTTRLILEHKGYEVSTARDGEDALESLRGATFDVVLMDIRMPGMSGVDVFEEIRMDGSRTAFVFMTAYAMDDVVSRVLEAGAVDVLRKPVDVDRLLALLDDLCRASNKREA